MSEYLVMMLIIITINLYMIVKNNKNKFLNFENYNFDTEYIVPDDTILTDNNDEDTLRLDKGMGTNYMEDLLLDEGDTARLVKTLSVNYEDVDRGAAGGPSARFQSKRADQ